jgi:SAM-dependent methyltransferase
MPPEIKPYYAPGALSTLYYDAVAAADPALRGDIDLYATLAGRRRSILELGAGTGRVAIALAERGFRVTGVDLAPAMLAQAEMRRGALPAEIATRIRFVEGDIATLDLSERFDAIFATYFTLAHLPIASWAGALTGIASHLAPGGVVALHLPLAEKMAVPPPPPDRMVFRHAFAGGRTLALYVADQSLDRASGRMVLALDYVLLSPNGAEEHRSREQLTYYVGDPDLYAAAAGLRRTRAPIPLGATGLVHVFAKEDGADDGT